MRDSFKEWIFEKAIKDPSIVVVSVDNGFSVFKEFKAKFPDRFFNVGICEQAAVSMAAGLAIGGMRPYVFTITPFLLERAYEQIKIDIDSQNLLVTLVGYWDYSKEGITHTCLDEDALAYSFKNIYYRKPSNRQNTVSILEDCYLTKIPAFISLVKADND